MTQRAVLRGCITSLLLLAGCWGSDQAVRGPLATGAAAGLDTLTGLDAAQADVAAMADASAPMDAVPSLDSAPADVTVTPDAEPAADSADADIGPDTPDALEVADGQALDGALEVDAPDAAPACVPAKCDDGNVCTEDSCDLAGACTHSDNAAPCDDGVACTPGDQCNGGKCLPTLPCACAADADCAAAEDGNLCNGTLSCDTSQVPAVCKVIPQTLVVCDATADSACLAATCDPQTGQCKLSPTNGGAGCDDGKTCTTNDKCTGGVCAGKANCDDGNVCTWDYCVPVKGCIYGESTAFCPDDDPCTVAEFCKGKTCTAIPNPCDDGYACTADSCDPVKGCQHTPVSDPNCGVLALPYESSLTCGNEDITYWHLQSSNSVVAWGFDAWPYPHFLSPGCSLNVQGEPGLGCPVGITALGATADSPWFDATKLAPNAVRIEFQSMGLWSVGDVAAVLYRTSDGDWTQIGIVQPPKVWAKQTFHTGDVSGKKIQFRFQFSGTCGFAGQNGWFVDDIKIAVDPCALKNGGCPVNTACSIGTTGGVVCLACPPGLKNTGTACVDIDECATPGTCGANATCTNTVGSFTCACNPGYSGDGKTCTDIDECAKAGLCGANATCTNTVGAYLCNCPAKYAFDGITCAKRGTKGNPGVSCLEILTFFPGSADGSYWLDPDGPDGDNAEPATYTCDMQGGGWTLLIWDDFEEAGSEDDWWSGSVTKCGSFGAILGGYGVFGAGSFTVKHVIAPPHEQYKLEASYVFIDAWNGEVLRFAVNDATIWTEQHFASTSNCKSGCGSAAVCEAGSSLSLIQSKSTPYVSSMSVFAKSTLTKAANVASFGIDNVHLWVK